MHDMPVCLRHSDLLSFHNACHWLSSAAAVLWDQQLFVANAGDSRAVLCRRTQTGQASSLDLSADHKPSLASELQRMAPLLGGSVVCDGYLGPSFGARSQVALGVSRALADFNLTGEGLQWILQLAGQAWELTVQEDDTGGPHRRQYHTLLSGHTLTKLIKCFASRDSRLVFAVA